jgi:8-oxo-dGTP pyrophosphatase MutT (NUDIX family)
MSLIETSSGAPSPSVPAATIILYHEDSDGPAVHLMITRSAGMVFAAGALVFPGGRLEADDRAIAADAALVNDAPDDLDDAAARVAAIRETIEETGLPVAIRPVPDAPSVSRWRQDLKNRIEFSAVLRTAGAALDLQQLTPFSRWSPSLNMHRRFDTRFYVAKFEGDIGVEVDRSEASQHVWISAHEAITGCRAGRHQIIFPTLRNLERLAAHPRHSEVLAHLKHFPVKMIMPQVLEKDGAKWLCIPEDAGYPVTRVPLSEVIVPR